MKILLVYPNIVESPKDFSIGLAMISSVLKQHNHEVKLLDTTFYKPTKEETIKFVKEFNPELVAFTTGSNNLTYAKTIAQTIKKNIETEIIFGGYHATVSPEDIIKEPYIDMVAIGEGEQTIKEIANKK